MNGVKGPQQYPYDRLVSYKELEHGITSDAPFVGARICAMDCHNDCVGCFNQHLKLPGVYHRIDSVDKIIQTIKANPVNQGIILGGLEWSEQCKAAQALIYGALQAQLKVILYTHHTEEEFMLKFSDLYITGIYVKFGEYKHGIPGYYAEEFDVYLASGNQYIKKIT